MLAATYREVHAIDLSTAALDAAREAHAAPNIAYEQADVFDVDGRYDCVFSSGVLHHVDDLDGALAHLRSLVAPGGRAVFVDGIRPSSGDQFLTAAEFDATYGRHFPGATFTQVGHLRACLWQE